MSKYAHKYVCGTCEKLRTTQSGYAPLITKDSVLRNKGHLCFSVDCSLQLLWLWWSGPETRSYLERDAAIQTKGYEAKGNALEGYV